MLHEQFLSFDVVGCCSIMCVRIAELVTKLTNAVG